MSLLVYPLGHITTLLRNAASSEVGWLTIAYLLYFSR